MVAFYDLFNLLDRADKLFNVFFIVTFQRNGNKRTHTQSHAGRIYQGMIASNDTGLFQLFYTLQRGRGRQPDFLRQLSIGDVGVCLE